MKITLAQWLELHKLQKEAVFALSALVSAVSHFCGEHQARGHYEEKKLLLEIGERVSEADAAILAIDLRPVDEWVGGEDSKLREPASIGGGLSIRRYFTPEEIAEARQKGLLR